jgi:hypothetical protein
MSADDGLLPARQKLRQFAAVNERAIACVD